MVQLSSERLKLILEAYAKLLFLARLHFQRLERLNFKYSQKVIKSEGEIFAALISGGRKILGHSVD